MKKLRFLMPVGFLAVAAGFSAVVMLLWNWLMPTLFGLGVISFWQALGILVLSRILFGGFGGGHGMKRHKFHAGHHLHDKWMKMTPEQRQEFASRRMEHLGNSDFFGEPFHADEQVPKEQE